MKFKYIRLDADNIGDNIELALLNDEVEKAQKIHFLVQQGLKKLQEKIINSSYLELMMVGGDDILMRCKQEEFDLLFLEELKNIFHTICNFTISIGAGDTLQDTLVNLKKAKLSGKNKIVF